MTTLNPAARKRRGVKAALAVALAGAAILVAAPAANASGHTPQGNVGTVCGATPGEIVRVTIDKPSGINTGFDHTWEHVVETRDAWGDHTGAEALQAQIDLNGTAPRVTQDRIVTDDTVAYRARVGTDGCVTVPTTGTSAATLRIQTTGVNAVVAYTPELHYDAANRVITWTDAAVTSSSSKAAPAERTYDHADVLSDAVGWHVDLAK